MDLSSPHNIATNNLKNKIQKETRIVIEGKDDTRRKERRRRTWFLDGS